MIGLMWFDNITKSWVTRVDLGLEHYIKKFGRKPIQIRMNTANHQSFQADLKAAMTVIVDSKNADGHETYQGIEIIEDSHILPSHILYVQELA